MTGVSMVTLADFILPVRNGAATIERALASIAAQTETRFRCFVIDDGSTDDTVSRVAAFMQSDPRFVLVRSPARGIVSALQLGLARVEAPVVVRADADDWNAPRRLELQLQFLADHPDIAVVGSLVRFEGPQVGERLRAYEAWLNSLRQPLDIARDLFVESPLAHPSVCLRTKCLREVGGYREGPFPEDYDLWLRLFRAHCRFAKVEEELVVLADHPARLTRTDPRYRARAFLNCKCEHLLGDGRVRNHGVRVWGAGRDGVRLARELKRRGVEIAGFVDISPTKLGKQLVGVQILPPESLAEPQVGPLLVVAVGVRGARAKIRSYLERRSYREGAAFGEGDFVCFG